MSYDRIRQLQKSFGMIGNSDALAEIVETIDQVAETDITVLISGESGTGKELIADGIHKHSLRKHKPFVKVNCGAIPSGILESELFGHIKGAFTGAVESRQGYFETANNGTIFLDEIGEMPLETQVKLLRVLETGEFLPVGGSKSITVDVRIIAATNKNLAEEIEKGDFRKDLYYRLKTITVVAPPLRNRPDDIPKLVEKFALDFANRNNIAVKGFSPNAMLLLQRYNWPGNIRELKNFVESMIVLQKGEVINSTMIERQLMKDQDYRHTSPNLPVRVSKSTDQAERELILQQLLILRRDMDEIKGVIMNYAGGSVPLNEEQTYAVQKYLSLPTSQKPKLFDEEEVIEEKHAEEGVINPGYLGSISLEEVERELIEKTLDKFDNKKRQTANALKISERTLYRKIKEYGLE